MTSRALTRERLRSERVMHRWWEDGHRALHAYKSRVDSASRPGTLILHAGCGSDRHDVTRPYRARARVVGVDLDPRSGSVFHGEFCCADLADLPFARERFDLIVCEYVFEHLADPRAVLLELARVLRPGGRIIALTPNLYSYKSLLALATPTRVHHAIGHIRYGDGCERHMYPTRFRCNTARRFRRLSGTAGLRVESVTFITNGPTWFRGVPVAFEIAHLFHRATEIWPPLETLRCSLLVELTH